MSEEKPRVGVGVMVFDPEGKVLLTRRKGSHGEGEYSFPGGHLEHGETFEECAAREVFEESGIRVCNFKFQYLANVFAYMPKQYVHIGMTAQWCSGTPRVMEPDKAEEWKWYALSELPSPLFHMCTLALDSLSTGNSYYPDGEVESGVPR